MFAANLSSTVPAGDLKPGELPITSMLHMRFPALDEKTVQFRNHLGS
jgi:hypothetical protein